MPESYYKPGEPVDCPSVVDTSSLKGKTVIITGGGRGLGYQYSEAFIKAGSFVVIADLQPPAKPLEGSQSVFVKCDVTVWEDQVAVFETALQKSPNHRIDIVIPNAGVAGGDILAGLDEEKPQKPSTTIIDVNLTGTLYTTKLAGWYFRHYLEKPTEGCLILISSIMGYIDTQSSGLYAASKFGVRGLGCYLRRKGHLRVNIIAPWIIKTPMMREEFVHDAQKQLKQQGLDIAYAEDAVTAVLRISTDSSLNGRSFAIVPRELAPSGYLDLCLDDRELDEGSPQAKMQIAIQSLSYTSYGHNIGPRSA